MSEISAKTKEHPEPVTVNYDMPETLAELVKKFGEQVVETAANAQLIISLQAYMRRLIEAGKGKEEIQKEVDNWSPGVRSVVRQTPFERAASSLDKLTPEERASLLAKLQQLAAA